MWNNQAKFEIKNHTNILFFFIILYKSERETLNRRIFYIFYVNKRLREVKKNISNQFTHALLFIKKYLSYRDSIFVFIISFHFGIILLILLL